uniref:Uncharacterized protein n=1 Tax=Caenorhabditis japonica TaxID=281687 RepID=A0A8R1HNK0_CAEJA
MVKHTTTEAPIFDWNHVWISEQTIIEARETLIGALYIALKPGSLPSACVFAFDCMLTIVHFIVSSYILDDFTTVFLGTVYFPCTFLKLIYIAECLSSAIWIAEISETINQIFNMTIILSCIGYNFMCLFVAKYRKNIPLPVSRAVFAPILLFCSFLVVVPKLLFQRNINNLFQFTTQLFGSLFLLAQIAWNLLIFVCKKLDPSTGNCESKGATDEESKANDVVRNANGRLVWASWFSLILVVLAIPQIGEVTSRLFHSQYEALQTRSLGTMEDAVTLAARDWRKLRDHGRCFALTSLNLAPNASDYYVPLTPGWAPYHFLSQSLAQLNALFLSLAIFLVLPTYRSVIFSCCSNYNRIIKVEEIKIEKSVDEAKISPKALEKEAEAMANHQKVDNFRHMPPFSIHNHFPIPHIINQPHLRIFVAPPTQNVRKY